MEESFDPIARTRANYYTPGSPVQFIQVELLKGSISGEQAVCLTFKNISRVTLTALDILFKCKGKDGTVLCQDDFQYQDLEVKPGETFGMDDAVFVTSTPIGSVDVILKRVYNGNRVVQLDGIKRVRLPAPRRLPEELRAALEERVGRSGMKYAPQVLDNGWYCACGAFHPKEEDTVYCSECGSDRILLQNALNTLMQPEQPENETLSEEGETRIVGEEPTRMVREPEQGTRAYLPHAQEEPQTRVIEEPQTRVLGGTVYHAPRSEGSSEGHTRVMPSHAQRPEQATVVRPSHYTEPEEDEEELDDQDLIAENIIRWVPPLTALICAGIALYGFVYYQFFL